MFLVNRSPNWPVPTVLVMSRVSRPYCCLPTRTGQLLFIMSIFSVTQVLDTVYSVYSVQGDMNINISSVQCPVSSVRYQCPESLSRLHFPTDNYRLQPPSDRTQNTHTAANATALRCVFTALHSTTRHCNQLYCTAVRVHHTALQCSAPHCSAVQRATLQCIRLHFSVLLLDSLHCTQILAFLEFLEWDVVD